MKVTVTGGAGFIGANLVRQLLLRGASVSILDDFSSGFESNVADLDVTVHRDSILDPSAVARACEGADSVVHLAARGSVPRSLLDPVETHRVNASGTVNVLEAARAADAQIIFASSSSVYGANPTLPKVESLACAPLSPYAASKLAAESYVLAYQRSYGLPAVAFRFFNVYGPLQSADHQYAAVVPSFISAMQDSRPIPIYGDGEQTRDFTAVGSVVDVIASAIERRVSYSDAINLAFGTRTSLNELIELLERVSGRRAERAWLTSRVGDVRDSQADGARLANLFPGLVPEPLELGLRKTVEWFQSVRGTS